MLHICAELVMLPYQSMILRLVLAALLGGLVGLEREQKQVVAGWRTHMLVSLGSALVIIVSTYGFNSVISPYRVVLDPSRVAAQVVSGIGFLGAGTILFLRQEVIRGLTTAASLWTVAAVGLAVGSGLYIAAISTTFLIIIILALMKPIERWLFPRKENRRLRLTFHRERDSLSRLQEIIQREGMEVRKIVLRQEQGSEDSRVELTLSEGVTQNKILRLTDVLRNVEGVQEINW